MMRLPSLYQFFRHQVSHGFHRHGITEPATVDYVSDILARFAQRRQFHALRDADGRPLEYLVDLLEAWQQGEAASPAHGRFILRHLGEYTLFMSGIFRERLMVRGELNYYLAHGRSAYWRCADCELNPRQRQVYRHLHLDFGRISNTLDNMRREQFPLPPSADNMLTAFWRV
ncbi:hypothetical protein SCL_0654 [Sulfuricaulis limicola]|uniref:Uncharacterized protein n=1 Tax=Sulfuricaulis limicola TaxID=1620215 RepID=A0A1B4XDV7_9GAMM|nr:hypothetical protein [Sulfuricaulis limicola]BAV32976.1 hypothetical protein SCL_0654 [Sulfuricaulis limicola]